MASRLPDYEHLPEVSEAMVQRAAIRTLFGVWRKLCLHVVTEHRINYHFWLLPTCSLNVSCVHFMPDLRR